MNPLIVRAGQLLEGLIVFGLIRTVYTSIVSASRAVSRVQEALVYKTGSRMEMLILINNGGLYARIAF